MFWAFFIILGTGTCFFPPLMCKVDRLLLHRFSTTCVYVGAPCRYAKENTLRDEKPQRTAAQRVRLHSLPCIMLRCLPLSLIPPTPSPPPLYSTVSSACIRASEKTGQEMPRAINHLVIARNPFLGPTLRSENRFVALPYILIYLNTDSSPLQKSAPITGGGLCS